MTDSSDWSVAEATALANVVKHAENDCCHDDAWRGRFCPYHLGMVDGVEVAMLALRGELPERPCGACLGAGCEVCTAPHGGSQVSSRSEDQ